VPGHEFVDAALHPAIHQPGQHIGEVPLRIDAVQLAGLHQRGDASPALATIVARGEQGILPVPYPAFWTQDCTTLDAIRLADRLGEPAKTHKPEIMQ